VSAGWARTIVVLLIGCVFSPVGADDGSTLRPADERFVGRETEEVPDFQRHVVPLLGRLGCNGRACHGSFQGRGGMRLSLFGYDFGMDHAALTAPATMSDEQRSDLRATEKSLILQKPTLGIDHEGGKRFGEGSWQYNLLSRWIESAAQGAETQAEIVGLEVTPSEVVFGDSSQQAALRVIAVWHDGSREDVTPLSRFRSNDDSVVTVDSDGRLQSVGAGDSHVIAFYDNGVAAVPVMRAAQSPSSSPSAGTVARTDVDRWVAGKLAKLGIVPSEICTDAEFLRRISIDLTGTLPTPAEIESFLADQSKDKRDRKIDQLLERPTYAAWWANKFCDYTGCNPSQQAELGQQTAVQWYTWIYHRLLENMPYDEMVQRIVLSVGRDEEQSFDEYCEQQTASFQDAEPQRFASRRTMPHYWTRRNLAEPEDKALAFAHSFLGIRLQCAQCHKHPFAPWTQDDFKQFAAFFEPVRYGVAPASDHRYRQLAGKVGLSLRGDQGAAIRIDLLKRSGDDKLVPWRELYIADRDKPESLSLLRSGTVDIAAHEDPRGVIMQWMKQPEHPWFARALVNRVWAGYFGVGIIDPPDDLSPANPPSNPALLDGLTRGFVANHYDLKWLHRQIIASDTYQRSWRPNETNHQNERHFSRAIPRRIPAEVLYDALKQVTASSDQLDEVRSDLTRRAIGHLSMRMAGTYAMHVFGKPERAVNCDCERVNQPTLLQSVFLQNDPLVSQRLAESGWINEIAQWESNDPKLDHGELVNQAWLRALGRMPTGREKDRAIRHLAGGQSVPEAMRDLLWALLNTKEFVLN
jgi:hypothetical protein